MLSSHVLQKRQMAIQYTDILNRQANFKYWTNVHETWYTYV